MPSSPSHSDPLPLELWDLAGLLGGFRWIESTLFRLAGGWIPTTPEPAVRVMWSVQSFHHAWHADVWRDRLPQLRGLNPELVTVAPSPDWETALATAASMEATADRLAVWFGGLVPALIAAYETLEERVDDVAAPGLQRWIRHVLLDERDDLRAGLGIVAAHPTELHPQSVLPADFVPNG
ncbi:MAG: hypothetical protein ACKOYM_07885 [Actinomycetes bacterium]